MTGVRLWTTVGLPWLPPGHVQWHAGMTTFRHLIPHSSVPMSLNVNWFNSLQHTPLYSLFVSENGYTQLVLCTTTNSSTCIAQIYTNLPSQQVSFEANFFSLDKNNKSVTFLLIFTSCLIVITFLN